MESQANEQQIAEVKSELEGYFRSIQDSFEPSVRIAIESESGAALLVALTMSIFSVLPVIPVLCWATARSLFPHWAPFIRGWRVPTYSFLFWWLALAVISVATAFAINRFDSRRSQKQRKVVLSAPVMRFSLCYATVQEIERYTRNHLPKHTESAAQYWEQFYPRLVMMLDPYGVHIVSNTIEMGSISVSAIDPDTEADLVSPGFGIGAGTRYGSIFPQIDLLRLSYSWFRLDEATSKIVNAFNSLFAKITGRLKDKKDLLSVADALRQLAVFLYCSIPEISTIERPANRQLNLLAEQSLTNFAEILQALPPYVPEPRKLGQKEKATIKLTAALSRGAALFASEKPLLKFFVWWLLVQALVVVSVVTAAHYLSNLKFDSTLISFMIGTPLLVAVAALAAPIRKA